MEKELEIINKLGLHARAAAKLAACAREFQCDLWVDKAGQRANAKSIMGLMMLAAGKGSILQLVAEGVDASEAVSAIESLMAQRFGESE
jgi:phosphocarrier protein